MHKQLLGNNYKVYIICSNYSQQSLVIYAAVLSKVKMALTVRGE